MKKTTQTKDQKPMTNPKKSYSLTEEETGNLMGREKFSTYIMDLVQRDIGLYLSQVIYKRLDLSPDTKAEISQDRKTLLVDDTPKIIIP
jgi:hypothetical protein